MNNATMLRSRRSHKASVLLFILVVPFVGAFHPNSYTLAGKHYIDSPFVYTPTSLIANSDNYARVHPSSSSKNCCSSTTSRRRDRMTSSTSLYGLLESGIESLRYITIFAAVLFLLSSQREKAPVDEITFDTKKGRNELSQTEETPKQEILFQKEIEHENEDLNSIEHPVTEIEPIDNNVSLAEEEMIESSDDVAIDETSYSSTVSFATPNIDEMKRRVASTLASEKAKSKRLEEQEDSMILQSQDHESKSRLMKFPRKSKNRSRVLLRLVKKMIMPWRKF
mmetsp:Transcript_10821/g.20237  ORF Transcript_10821/g.20237 Transcript_10821/m.20237 type:complete len:281 (+) Transcript_10821:89-931(+)